MSDDLNIRIPKGAVEGVVNAHIQAAVAKALGANPQALIDRVVHVAMHAKKDSYSRETLFEAAVARMIRQVAEEEFKVWLEENKVKIREALRKKLSTQGFAKMLSDHLADSCYVSVNVQLKAEHG